MPNMTDEDDIDSPPTAEDLHARSQYLQRLAGEPKRKRSKRPLAIALILLLLLAAGGGVYAWYRSNHKATLHPAPPQTKTETVQADNTPSDGSTKKYVATGQDINLTFEYPGNWTAEPASGTDTDDKPITLTSPLTTITNAAGQSATGKIVVSIRPGNSVMNELNSGKATAAEKSEQFAYKSPSPNQYQYPFLVFIHLSGGTNSTNGFEEVVVSGNTSFNKGDAITNDSLSPDPIISAAFFSCTSKDCSGNNAVPLSISHETWTSDAVFQQVLALFESLSIQ